MNLRFGAELDAFRTEARQWLESELSGQFAPVRGRGGPGDEASLVDERRAWEHRLGAEGWIGLGWPVEHGGRGLGLWHEVVWAEEYARARGPGRLGHIGEQLTGPTVIAFGSEAQKRRFLPPILAGDELWCQGFSEPDAGSDLANVATRARREGDEWIVDGQKVWTSLAHLADWCFVLARTDPGSARHRGLSFLLVPVRQPGVEIRPIFQMTADSEFNETWFAAARTDADNVIGSPGDGWKVAMGTLAFERGISTLAQQLVFDSQLADIVAVARCRGLDADPVVRQRIAAIWGRLRIMRLSSLRALSLDSGAGATASAVGAVGKLAWASLHRDLGELGAAVLGPSGHRGPGGWHVHRRPAGPALSVHPGRHHLRREQPDPAQPDRRTDPRTAEAAVTVPPRPVEGHRLLDGQVVVVTAAAGTGIGLATARRCAEEGATVVVSDAHERRLGEAADQLASATGRRPLAVVCDVTDEETVAALFAGTVEAHGRVDVVVNNAGLGGTAALVDMTDEQWAVVLDVTLTGTFRCVRAALRQMQSQGHGVIVNNASVLGWRAQAGQAHYAAAKAGVMALTRCAAVEAAEFGVRVNAVAPSLAMHPFLSRVTTDEVLTELTNREAFGRAAEPWEVANAIVFLASDYSSYLTGEVVSVSSQHP